MSISSCFASVFFSSSSVCRHSQISSTPLMLLAIVIIARGKPAHCFATDLATCFTSGERVVCCPRLSTNKVHASSIERGSTLTLFLQFILRHTSKERLVKTSFSPSALTGIPTLSRGKWFHTSSRKRTHLFLLTKARDNLAALFLSSLSLEISIPTIFATSHCNL
ncbi:hypothetical protein V8G54_026755 [Vigna mungo]|uniref:Uncharacterized protein n=1 Tax=Vigna mungo TaxID=3915 RepID=A0AAQ3N0X8_VIGMU